MPLSRRGLSGRVWQLLKDDRYPITEIPSDRFDVGAYYDSKPSTPGKVITRLGGFLKNIDQFDASFFGISPREAVRLDPQQTLLLEVALEAFEDAGLIAERLAASRASVFVGLWANDYERSMFNACSDIGLYATTGGGRYAASGRISYAFDLRGPSMTVDTACSSSLVTVHLAGISHNK
jgi:acyl transferase domain-containing protein